MDYHYFLNDLIAYMQREGVLSTDSEEFYNQLAEITGATRDEIDEILWN